MSARSSRSSARVAAKILPDGEEAGHQEGGLHEIAAVILGAEGERLAGAAVEPVREDAVMAIALGEETHRMEQAFERGFAPDPAALDAGEDRHETKAGAAARHDVELAIAALARQPADGMREIPEIPERPPLDEIEQRHVRSRGIRKANWSGGHVALVPGFPNGALRRRRNWRNHTPPSRALGIG